MVAVLARTVQPSGTRWVAIIVNPQDECPGCISVRP